MTPPIAVASLGFENSLILMVLALVVFGPRRLPEIGRQIGKLMYEVRKASNDFKFQMEDELRKAEDADRRKKEEERLATLALAAPAEMVAQIPGPEAVEPSATPALPASAVESPYSGEGVYPEIDEYKPTETFPQIQPPSTGEPVAAAPPTEAPAAKKAVRAARSKPTDGSKPSRAKRTVKKPETAND